MTNRSRTSNGNADIHSAEQALRRSRRLKSIWSEESQLTQRILIYIAEILERQARPKKRRAVSQWQKFAAQAVREGKTLKQAALEWKDKR